MIVGASSDSFLKLRSRSKKDRQRANHFEIARVSCIPASPSFFVPACFPLPGIPNVKGFVNNYRRV